MASERDDMSDTEERDEDAIPERRTGSDRRRGVDRRKQNIPVPVDRRKADRRSSERRRQIDPTTCEREYDDEEMIFLKAIEDYKRAFHRPFPTWSEVLEILKSLGYRKVAEPTVITRHRTKPSDTEEAEEQ